MVAGERGELFACDEDGEMVVSVLRGLGLFSVE